MKETVFKKINKKRGFTLFISITLASLLLAIGFSLAGFTVKQLIISTSGRESQFAFYAADTGVECAVYWDFKYGGTSAFATSSDSVTYGLVPASGLKCNDKDIIVDSPAWSIVTSATRATTTFAFSFSPQPYCVVVTVGKSGAQTTVESRGYNMGVLSNGPSCTSSNTRRVERAIRVRY